MQAACCIQEKQVLPSQAKKQKTRGENQQMGYNLLQEVRTEQDLNAGAHKF